MSGDIKINDRVLLGGKASKVTKVTETALFLDGHEFDIEYFKRNGYWRNSDLWVPGGVREETIHYKSDLFKPFKTKVEDYGHQDQFSNFNRLKDFVEADPQLNMNSGKHFEQKVGKQFGDHFQEVLPELGDVYAEISDLSEWSVSKLGIYGLWMSGGNKRRFVNYEYFKTHFVARTMAREEEPALAGSRPTPDEDGMYRTEGLNAIVESGYNPFGLEPGDLVKDKEYNRIFEFVRVGVGFVTLRDKRDGGGLFDVPAEIIAHDYEKYRAPENWRPVMDLELVPIDALLKNPRINKRGRLKRFDGAVIQLYDVEFYNGRKWVGWDHHGEYELDHNWQWLDAIKTEPKAGVTFHAKGEKMGDFNRLCSQLQSLWFAREPIPLPLIENYNHLLKNLNQ